MEQTINCRSTDPPTTAPERATTTTVNSKENAYTKPRVGKFYIGVENLDTNPMNPPRGGKLI